MGTNKNKFFYWGNTVLAPKCFYYAPLRVVRRHLLLGEQLSLKSPWQIRCDHMKGNQSNQHIYSSLNVLRQKAYFPNNSGNNASLLREKHIVHSANLNNIDRNKADRLVEDVHSCTSIELVSRNSENISLILVSKSELLKWENSQPQISFIISKKIIIPHQRDMVHYLLYLQVEIYFASIFLSFSFSSCFS